MSTPKNKDEKPALYKKSFHGEQNGNTGRQEPQDSRYRVLWKIKTGFLNTTACLWTNS